jgi:hypothetical protein
MSVLRHRPIEPEAEAEAERGQAMRRSAIEFAAPVVAIVVELLVCHYDNPAKVGGLGLITVTPWPVYAIAFMLSASFALLLRSEDLPQMALVAHIGALGFLLPGLPGLLEALPRFTTAWLHVGFIQAIIIHKHPIVGLDARFSWPGFFTGVASLVGMAHLDSALPFLRWTPLVFNLAYALPVFIIARSLLTLRLAWLVVWAFILTNWVGQDYFSPQGLAYFIFLSCVALLLFGFHRHAAPLPGRHLRPLLMRLGEPLRANLPSPTGAQRAGLLTVLMLAVIALSMEHQLTPVVLAVDIIALVVARQIYGRFFAAAVVVAVVVWISYGASTFWAYHLSNLFGSGGSQAVQATVTSRLSGSHSHELVVYERLAFSFGLWLIAGIAALWGLIRRSPVSWSAMLLASVPFVVLAAQSYGGEVGLRIYFYTLPFMLIIVIGGFADLLPQRSAVTVGLITLISTALVPLLLIARFGNEQFEQVTRGDIAAAQYVYSVATPGASIGTVAPNAVVGFRGLAAYYYPSLTFANDGNLTPKQVLRGIKQNPFGTYVLITPAQIENQVVNNGNPANWGTKLEARLNRNRRFKLLFHRFGGYVYEIEPPSLDRASDG